MATRKSCYNQARGPKYSAIYSKYSPQRFPKQNPKPHPKYITGETHPPKMLQKVNFGVGRWVLGDYTGLQQYLGRLWVTIDKQRQD
eukprot:6419793-Amphidinium_carterae.1